MVDPSSQHLRGWAADGAISMHTAPNLYVNLESQALRLRYTALRRTSLSIIHGVFEHPPG